MISTVSAGHETVSTRRGPSLTTDDLAIGYRATGRPPVVLADALRLRVDPGEIVCLLGANGAGKSTLLRTLAGMQPPVTGSVSIGGADVHRLRPRELAKRLALVLTDRVSVGVLSAYALVALGRHPHTNWAGRIDASDHEAVRHALTTVGAQHLAARQVNELSDGERQKVMIARALAQDTPLLIIDEITAFLDLPRRIEMMAMLRDLAHREGKAILVSSHDLELALRTADWLWLMSPCARFDVGTPEELVMNGALARAFESDAVEFDAQSGHFRATRKRTQRVRVEGNGSLARWTIHALERCGYEVADAIDAPVVCVVDRGSKPGWVLQLGGRATDHTSLRELTVVLRQECPPS
jgi:iron complex transport system ATP-binding protein